LGCDGVPLFTLLGFWVSNLTSRATAAKFYGPKFASLDEAPDARIAEAQDFPHFFDSDTARYRSIRGLLAGAPHLHDLAGPRAFCV
jgi:hypothetical protein